MFSNVYNSCNNQLLFGAMKLFRYFKLSDMVNTFVPLKMLILVDSIVLSLRQMLFC